MYSPSEQRCLFTMRVRPISDGSIEIAFYGIPAGIAGAGASGAVAPGASPSPRAERTAPAPGPADPEYLKWLNLANAYFDEHECDNTSPLLHSPGPRRCVEVFRQGLAKQAAGELTKSLKTWVCKVLWREHRKRNE